MDHECQFKRVMVKVIALEPIVSEGIALQIGLTNSYYLGNIFQVIFAICKYHFCDLQISLILNHCPVFYLLSNNFNPKTIHECTYVANLESPHSSDILLLRGRFYVPGPGKPCWAEQYFNYLQLFRYHFFIIFQ